MITIDGGTGRVMLGEVPLVPPQINDDFQTILEWADELRRLRVHANADTPEDAAKARELGAEGIGLCRTEHMFMAEDRLPVMREMILADSEGDRRAALERILPMQQADFEGIFEAMAGLPVTIRLLDPPLHEFLPPLEEATDDRMRERIRVLHETNPMLGIRGCRVGLIFPEIYEMQVRAIVRASKAVHERTGEAPIVEIMHPLVGFGEELRRLRELTVETVEEEGEIEYLVGTMIELPRACIRADEIAPHADFFSFGTNDLTQTTLGYSRDDAENKFLARYLEDDVLERNPFEVLDEAGRRRPDADRRRAGERREGGPQARHLRRARRRAALGRVLPPDRARLRLLLAVPRPARPARGGPGGARGGRRRGGRRRRLNRPFRTLSPRRGSRYSRAMRRAVVLVAVLAAAAALTSLALAATGALRLFSPPRQIVQFGYVASVTQKGREYVLRFDPALWLEGQTANVAAAEDGAVKPGEAVANDYWIRNPDHKLLTYKLPANAHVTILVQLQTTKVTVTRLAQLLTSNAARDCAGRYVLRPPCRLGFWLRYATDTVKSLDQQYQP